jgi:hypothetical protein
MTLEHRTPERIYPVAIIAVSAERPPPPEQQFEVLRSNQEWVAERERLAPYLSAPPTRRLRLSPRWTWVSRGPVVYACPMHPEVVNLSVFRRYPSNTSIRGSGR